MKYKFNVGEKVRIIGTGLVATITKRDWRFFEMDSDVINVLPRYYSFNNTQFKVREDGLQKLIFCNYEIVDGILEELTRVGNFTKPDNPPPFL